jgi:hypothetical protein
MKPILLLDVDGVLNVLPRKRPVRARRIPVEIRGQTFHLQFFPNKRTLRFLRMTWENFDVRWLTAWRDGANAIARYYGLPERRVIRDVGGESWKARSAASALRDWKGPVAWIEDGVDDAAKALIVERGWRYFHCDPFVGVTGQHMKDLRCFAIDQSGVGRRAEKRA